MHISTEAIVAIVSLIVAAPCTMVLLWGFFRRQQKDGKTHHALHATHLGHHLYANEGRDISAPVEITLEAGLLISYRLANTPSRPN